VGRGANRQGLSKRNPKAADLQLLMERLGVGGQRLTRLRLVLPHWMRKDKKLMRRLRPYKDLGLQIVELRVHLREIGQPGLEAAIGGLQDAPRFVQRLLQEAQEPSGRFIVRKDTDVLCGVRGRWRSGRSDQGSAQRLGAKTRRSFFLPAVVRQPPGVALLGFKEATERAYAEQAVQVQLRPTCVHAGGETVVTPGGGELGREEEGEGEE
jgi:hypothetical protein